MSTTSALRRALAAKTEEARLEALLLAWRANRQPRIADLIDRLSGSLVKAAGKVKGASMPERTKQCLALCKTKNPVALGQVLATEWPGTWQPALPLLEAVLKLPDDPRVAAHFAKQVDATRYDTWTSKTYWKPLFRRLGKLGDVRQLALLEQQLLRAKGEYYARDMRPMEEAVVKALKAVKVKPLSKTFAGQLARLPDTTRIYPGHDYIENNLNFTLDREPDNATAQALLERVETQDPAEALVTTLADEKEVNTFLRLTNATVIERLRERFPELPDDPDPRTVFVRLRELRNQW